VNSAAALGVNQAISEVYIPRACTVKRFIVNSRVNTANVDVVFTLMINGVASGLVLTYPSSKGSGVVIASQDVSLSAGDLITIKITSPGYTLGSLFITSTILELLFN
jgi:hypothetical protein